MSDLSKEQNDIVGAPLDPLSVIACAGSGKTKTAIHRLIEVRKKLGNDRGRVALLSSSNIAVDTFRAGYRELAHDLDGFSQSRVDIDTMDGFFTSNVIRSHAARTMRCDGTPFLVSGAEPFLNNKDLKFWAQPPKSSAFPVPPDGLNRVVVNLQDGAVCVSYRHNSALFPINNGPEIAARLGKIGAYTHDLARYWCHRALIEQPEILRVLAHRYPHILVDEAQDIGTFHQAILELLAASGTQVSLFGDPHQGIYGFAGADGTFLAQYGRNSGVKKYALTCNYRSVPPILKLANKLSERTNVASRETPETPSGVHFIPYKPKEREKLTTAFRTEVQKAGLRLERSAVLCRGRAQVDQLTGKSDAVGQGVVKRFARAALLRDKGYDYKGAFKAVAGSVVSLLDDPPQHLLSMLTQPARYPDVRKLRREIWRFTRNSRGGLPAATLIADTGWQPLLLQNVKTLLQSLQVNFGLTPVSNLGRKVTRKALPNNPLITEADLAEENKASIRVDTVHQAKGESLDAVLYLANKDQIDALLAGVSSEAGRIGYVALTRSRNLFWLGVPVAAMKELRPALLAKEFLEIKTT